MKTRSRTGIALALALGGLILAGYSAALAPAAPASVRAAVVQKATPGNAANAKRLARLAATQLVKDYSKGRVTNVCNNLTAKFRKTLGGASCAAKVRTARRASPISKVAVTKITLRSARSWANVSGYLNGKRTQRLTVALKWEGGKYRLDHFVVG